MCMRAICPMLNCRDSDVADNLESAGADTANERVLLRAQATPGATIDRSVVDNDISSDLIAQVKAAYAAGRILAIRGGGTKCWWVEELDREVLDTTPHSGIVSYEPTELVLTARAGTRLADVVAALDSAGQALPFEPPMFGANATLGGAVACGVSGPRRPWGGAVRDAVLGVELINGAAERLTFGGQVMKNVAGYDVSRLMVGARGTLGVLTQISVKVLPKAECEVTCVLQLERDAALARVVEWNRSPLPLSATCHVVDRLSVRLSGAHAAVEEAATRIGGVRSDDSAEFWCALRDQRSAFFDGAGELWRFSLPHAARMPRCSGEWLIEWAGAQRWLRSATPLGDRPFVEASALGGHAQRWRPSWQATPLPAAQRELQMRLQHAFDPRGVFGAGRL